MNIGRICTTVAAVTLASFVVVDIAGGAPQQVRASRPSLTIHTVSNHGTFRGGGILHCDSANTLVSENLDMGTITPGNSVSCFGGSGTPEHSYGRSHDLSLGLTAGLPLEIRCIHFGLAQNSLAGFAAVHVYLDLDGVAGPTPDGSDLWPLGTVEVPVPATETPLVISASPVTPFPLAPDSLIFIEIVIPESYPGTHEIGSNTAGELSSTWLRTTNGECGIGSWINPSALGFPNMHLLEAIEVAEATLADPCEDSLVDCAEDVDGDGIVAVSDILSIIGNWGNCGDGSFRPVGDIAPLPNGDCCVTVADILAVISAWGNECNPGGGIDGLGINELRIDMPGSDIDEFVELIGDAGAALDGYSYIVIGDSTAGGSGVIETIIDLTGQVINGDGLFSIAGANSTFIPDFVVEGLSFEGSDNVTHMLVAGLSLDVLIDQDLDSDDDGVFDDAYWLETVDAVGLLEVGFEGETVELLYTETILGPVGIYPPAHVFRCPDGGDWFMGVFASLIMDTPGELNMCDVPDLDGDGVFDLVDNCYLPNLDQADCNDNGVGDVCDIAEGVSFDCNSNAIPDECEDDCDGNGIPDECDIANGEPDCDGNGILDACEADCNENGVADACDIADGTSIDDNGNGVPDECEEGNIAYTSFEEPLIGEKYFDTGDALVDHQLVNNAGEAMVEWSATGPELGFTAWYVNTRDGAGLVDGDYVGVTDYTGSGVGSYPEGVQGYQMSDTDGLMRVDFDTVYGSGAWNLSIDLFVASTDYESDDAIVVEVTVDGGAILTLLDTTGLDIDDLGIEGVWFTLLQELTGYTEATLHVSFDVNSGSEAIFMDNVIFSSNEIADSDADGVPDAQDNCYLPNPDQLDCNDNGVGDVCDLAEGTSFDCNVNAIPDECETDCNNNGVPDDCDIADGTVEDTNGNGIPDICEVANEFFVITGVYDAQFSAVAGPKGVELFTLSAIEDLSLYGIGGAHNGGGSDGEEFTFPAIAVEANTYIYVTDDEVDFLTFFGFAADYQSSAMSINGDDAIELFENGVVIDTFGDIDVDGTGTAWDYMDGWAKRLSGTGPDGSIFYLDNWSYSGIDMLQGDSNEVCPAPFIFGGFTP